MASHITTMGHIETTKTYHTHLRGYHSDQFKTTPIKIFEKYAFTSEHVFPSFGVAMKITSRIPGYKKETLAASAGYQTQEDNL